MQLFTAKSQLFSANFTQHDATADGGPPTASALGVPMITKNLHTYSIQILRQDKVFVIIAAEGTPGMPRRHVDPSGRQSIERNNHSSHTAAELHQT
jgi:hypothetical protein